MKNINEFFYIFFSFAASDSARNLCVLVAQRPKHVRPSTVRDLCESAAQSPRPPVKEPDLVAKKPKHPTTVDGGDCESETIVMVLL
jgi:hypothetical protein